MGDWRQPTVQLKKVVTGQLMIGLLVLIAKIVDQRSEHCSGRSYFLLGLNPRHLQSNIFRLLYLAYGI